MEEPELPEQPSDANESAEPVDSPPPPKSTCSLRWLRRIQYTAQTVVARFISVQNVCPRAPLEAFVELDTNTWCGPLRRIPFRFMRLSSRQLFAEDSVRGGNGTVLLLTEALSALLSGPGKPKPTVARTVYASHDDTQHGGTFMFGESVRHSLGLLRILVPMPCDIMPIQFGRGPLEFP